MVIDPVDDLWSGVHAVCDPKCQGQLGKRNTTEYHNSQVVSLLQ